MVRLGLEATNVGVVKGSRLRWLSHVLRKLDDEPVDKEHGNGNEWR